MKLRTLAVTGAVVCSIVASGESRAASEVYVAKMSGAQTVPPRETTSMGDVRFTLDAANKLSGTVKLTNMERSQIKTVKLEFGACGAQPTAPRYTLEPPSSTGTITVNNLNVSEFAKEIRSGQMYIILRTSARPAGEIRGQLLKEGSTVSCPAK